jgi:hypothetical protein
MAIGVNAIQGELFGLYSHIRQKIAEILPSSTNRDATATIIGVILVLGISAAGEHAHPTTVSRREAHPVLSIVRGADFPCPAATGLGHAVFQAGTSDNAESAAFTPA